MRQQVTRAMGAGVNVTSPQSVQSLVDRVIREFGGLDLLVNDAAYNKWIPFPQLQDLRLEDCARILSVNLTGPFLCSKAVAPIMTQQRQVE